MIPCKIRWKPILKSIFKNQEWLFTFFDTNRKFNIHHFWPPICIKHYYTILQPKNKAKVHIIASSVVAMGIYCLTVKYRPGHPNWDFHSTYDFIKKSTIFAQWLWNLVKIKKVLMST